MQEKKCKDKVKKEYQDRLKDVRKAYNNDKKDLVEWVNKYSLSFDFVSPFTFTDQPEYYYRWQLSWGGPSDEFRIFTNSKKEIQYIEYWFLDWFDGSSIKVNDEEIKNICSFLLDGERYPHEYLEEEKEFEPVNIEYPKEERI